jgi:hypothetical protein
VLQVVELLAVHVIVDLANMINSYLHTATCQPDLVRVVTLEFMPTWSGVSIERLTTQFPLDKRVSETDPSTRLMPFSDFKQMRQMEPMRVADWDARLDFSPYDMTGQHMHWVRKVDRPYPNEINVEAFQAFADECQPSCRHFIRLMQSIHLRFPYTRPTAPRLSDAIIFATDRCVMMESRRH